MLTQLCAYTSLYGQFNQREQNSAPYDQTFHRIYLETIQKMQSAKITPLSIQQYAEISEHISDETERIEHDGILAAKCVKHPEYGDIILISSEQGGCIMIHFDPPLQSVPDANIPLNRLTQ